MGRAVCCEQLAHIAKPTNGDAPPFAKATKLTQTTGQLNEIGQIVLLVVVGIWRSRLVFELVKPGKKSSQLDGWPFGWLAWWLASQRNGSGKDDDDDDDNNTQLIDECDHLIG